MSPLANTVRERRALRFPRGPISAATRARSVTSMISPVAASRTHSLKRLFGTWLPTASRVRIVLVATSSRHPARNPYSSSSASAAGTNCPNGRPMYRAALPCRLPENPAFLDFEPGDVRPLQAESCSLAPSAPAMPSEAPASALRVQANATGGLGVKLA